MEKICTKFFMGTTVHSIELETHLYLSQATSSLDCQAMLTQT
jgi:hypothetical protein